MHLNQMTGLSMFKVKIFVNIIFFNKKLINLGWFLQENRLRAKLMKIMLSVIVKNIDKKRIAYFTANGKQHETLCIDHLIDHSCTKTNTEGLIKRQFSITNKNLRYFRISNGSIEYFMSTNDKKIRVKGESFLVDDNGISIISDIVSSTTIK